MNPAAQPGTHASFDSLSSEYAADVVQKRLSFLNESHCWSQKQHDDYQLKHLRRLLIYCNKHVPKFFRIFVYQSELA